MLKRESEMLEEMKYPEYVFEDLNLKVTFRTSGYQYVTPLVHERKMSMFGGWVLTSDKWAFSSARMDEFVGWEAKDREKFARRAAERWDAYLKGFPQS